MSTLTPREEAFAHAIAEGLGPSAAYREAYGGKGSPDTVASNAKRLMRRSHVQKRIEELQEGVAGGAGLTPKQERFCELYLEKSNASAAYRIAYDVGQDTRPATVNRKAAELLANGKITARLDALRADLRKRHEITVDYLVEQLRPIIEADIRQVVTWGEAVAVKDPETGEVTIAQGISIKAPSELGTAGAAMIAEITQSRDGTVRVRLHDKLAAIEKVARLLGLMKDQHDVNLKDVTPRPRDPGREVIMQSVRAFLTAANEYEERIAADEAERKGG
jgi:phage terminase small subunit